MNHARIEIFPDPESLSLRGADLFEEFAAATIAQKNRFTIGLSGGSTPKLLYSKLVHRDLSWSQIHLFWGDERFVPRNSADSNYRMVKEALLDFISIPEQNIHLMPGELTDHDKAATQYETELQHFFGRSAVPRLDLLYLGLGEDGHTASLFPGSPALREQQRWVVTAEGAASPHVPRLTLTLPVLNAAAQICFLVAGAAKAAPFKRVFEEQDRSLPASLIQPQNGDLLFLVDRAAAG
jgi:6-phosphogluconolactonase